MGGAKRAFKGNWMRFDKVSTRDLLSFLQYGDYVS